jgi:hypothetical protein
LPGANNQRPFPQQPELPVFRLFFVSKLTSFLPPHAQQDQ